MSFTRYKSPLKLKVSSIHICQAPYFQQSRYLTYRSEASDIIRKCFGKISSKKFLNNSKRATAQDPCRKSSVMESFLMKLLGWTLDLQLQWKKPPPQMFTCEYLELSEFYRKVLYELSFLIKFWVVYCRAAVLLRHWSTIDFFLKKRLSFF